MIYRYHAEPKDGSTWRVLFDGLVERVQRGCD